jgi:hypothetical protein
MKTERQSSSGTKAFSGRSAVRAERLFLRRGSDILSSVIPRRGLHGPGRAGGSNRLGPVVSSQALLNGALPIDTPTNAGHENVPGKLHPSRDLEADGGDGGSRFSGFASLARTDSKACSRSLTYAGPSRLSGILPR